MERGDRLSRQRKDFLSLKGALIIEHMHDDPAGYIGELLQEHNIPYEQVNVEERPVPDPEGYGAVIALGGSQHVYSEEQHPYFAQEKEMLKKVIDLDIPFLGLCLGGQLLADVLGGQVRQHTMTEIGYYDIPLTEEGRKDPLYRGLPGFQKVFHWHEDVFELPAGAVLLATNENAANQAFRYGHRAYGLQYHIEITPDILETWLWHPNFKQEAIEALGGVEEHAKLERARSQMQPIYHAHTRIMFENFLRISQMFR